MMKQVVLILIMLTAKVAVAQSGQIPAKIRSAFEGTWQHKTKHYSNTVKIQFKPGKDYALFIDIGTGVAPSRTFKVHFKENWLFLPAVKNQNDAIEMEVIKGKLHLRSIPVQWDENGNKISSDQERPEQKVFRRIKE